MKAILVITKDGRKIALKGDVFTTDINEVTIWASDVGLYYKKLHIIKNYKDVFTFESMEELKELAPIEVVIDE